MTEQINLVDALRPRVQLIAASAAYRLKRLGQAGLWDTYTGSEQLIGELYRDDAIAFRRAEIFSGTSKCVIYIEGIKPTDLLNQEFGPEVIIEGNIQERFHEDIKVDKGATYKNSISHTFGTTTTREDAYKQGLRILAEEAVHIGAESGVSGDFKSQQEFTSNFEQKYGSQRVQEDTISELSLIHI